MVKGHRVHPDHRSQGRVQGRRWSPTAQLFRRRQQHSMEEVEAMNDVEHLTYLGHNNYTLKR